MHIGIIGAMKEEVDAIKHHMEISQEVQIADCHFYKGTIQGNTVTLCQSGIGKVNAAVSTTLLVQTFSPDMIVNTGSAGGLNEASQVGDVVVADAVQYHDVDVTAFGYALGQVPGMPAVFSAHPGYSEQAIAIAEKTGLTARKGIVSSSDSFMGDATKVQEVKKQFPDVQAVEMEAAAIAQVCERFNVPFVMIRSLSDIAGKESNVSFEQFLETASINAAKVIHQFVEGVK
ncbi:5'-methylthioadenosine/S-adenosylhomocysteine nucleosidase [Aureibacillus halotolerans]|uniref:5'-methylthioadenosine/S-adenosylhomocysteine nucleosidase n=1 Tax=Aureibacillus halotolerans TaxID=1508390 RepID=A0A4R6TW10_9BACI|nr:5'-methylthioadenosine/S-adenosylhomocysteine nucleosidase [Aureibacillus halotolerans]TDQ38018.1 adenosylhomocysteine nucleosidase [Aureibacillus halotolerans]